MNKTRKIIVTLGLVSIVATLVGATLLQSVGTLNTTVNIRQAVTLDGHSWEVPVNESLNGTGGCYYFSTIHQLKNNGFDGVWLNILNNATPDLDGIQITVFYRTHHVDLVGAVEEVEAITMDTLNHHWTLLRYPFLLPGYACWDLCWMYHFNSLIVPQQYVISSVFVPGVV